MKRVFAFLVMAVCLVSFTGVSLAAGPADAAGTAETAAPSGTEADQELYWLNGHAYRAYDLTMTWPEAKEYCEQIGGHLVTVESQQENFFLLSLMGEMNIYWIGMMLDEDNQPVWVTGEPVEYTNFHPDEPDNFQGQQGYCLILNKNLKGWSAGEWSDLEIDAQSWDGDTYWSSVGFICEWDDLNNE